MKPSNIYSNIPAELPEELFESLVEKGDLKLERIVSKGQATLAGEWYDQACDEWVILLQGRAGLFIEGQDEVLVLKPGDYVLLPAHLKHRVEWTDAEQETVWLALHYLEI